MNRKPGAGQTELTLAPDRWELTPMGQMLHWPDLVDKAHSVCGRSLFGRRTDEHIKAYGSPLPHPRCKRCEQLAPQDALEQANP